jgi:hypothetical protein
MWALRDIRRKIDTRICSMRLDRLMPITVKIFRRKEMEI